MQRNETEIYDQADTLPLQKRKDQIFQIQNILYRNETGLKIPEKP
jgi:hypothetical protein